MFCDRLAIFLVFWMVSVHSGSGAPASSLTDLFEGPSLDPSWKYFGMEHLADTEPIVFENGRLKLHCDSGVPWYQSDVAYLMHKDITGPFDLRTTVRIRQYQNQALETDEWYRFGGLMIRNPRSGYKFVVVGLRGGIGLNQVETKNTVFPNGGSTGFSSPEGYFTPDGTQSSELRLVRDTAGTVTAYSRPIGSAQWVERPFLPSNEPDLGNVNSDPVQVGLIVYALGGTPDFVGIFDEIINISEHPAIAAHPQSQIVNVGSNATFNVTAFGNPPPAYQWFFNGSTPLAGATNRTLTVTNVRDGDAGNYSVVASNGESVTSSNALLTVNHPPVPAAPVLERLWFQGVKLRVSAFLGSDVDGDPLSLNSAGPGSLGGGTVTTSGGWVFYTPPPGFTNADSFSFAVSDGRGGISQGTATVIVTFDDTTPQNFRAEQLGNGAVRLVFDGIRHRTYSVEFNENLQAPVWQTLATVTADENGVFAYVDTLPSGAPQRFYRAAWP